MISLPQLTLRNSVIFIRILITNLYSPPWRWMESFSPFIKNAHINVKQEWGILIVFVLLVYWHVFHAFPCPLKDCTVSNNGNVIKRVIRCYCY